VIRGGWLLLWVLGVCLHAGDLWEQGPVLSHVRIVWDPAAERLLRSHPRDWVPARVTVDGVPEVPVRLRIKGSIGSFQPVDQRPGLTLDSLANQPVFRGIDRVHLDNGAEDPGRLDAAFGAEAFRRIGIPSPRVLWARVEVNGRDLGWYVLKEGLTPIFAARAGGKEADALAEPVNGADVGGDLSFKRGSEVPLRMAALRRWADLADAVATVDPADRWERVGQLLDREPFLRFAAAEVLLAHRDGYALARNNYRLRFSAIGVEWIPWGMDQLLVSDRFPLFPQMSGAVARGLTTTPEGRLAWDQILRKLAVPLFDLPAWETWMDRQTRALEPHLRGAEREALAAGMIDLRRRLKGRSTFVIQALATPVSTVPVWNQGVAQVGGWVATDLPPDGGAGEEDGPGKVPSLCLWAGEVTASSWRATVRLEPGRYRFQARVSTRGVKSMDFGRHHGAALRVLGEQGRSLELVEDSNGRELMVDFRVAEQARDLSLMCELRSRSGRVWFEKASLQLVRIE
jgi:hypothetical protein